MINRNESKLIAQEKRNLSLQSKRRQQQTRARVPVTKAVKH